jgi:ABC-2 type transport system ATP-binding protein
MGIYSDLTGGEVLDLLAGIDRRPIDKKLRQQLQERMELPDRDLRRRLREYSTGMKRKLGIIQAFQSDPSLLILDEPTEGLDPLMQESFYQLLADVKRRGRTVFMSSHVLSEVGRVCDRIALLRNGELALLASVDECRRLAARNVRVIFDRDVQLAPGLPPGIEIVAAGPRLWILKVEGPLGPLLSFLAALPVNDLEVTEPRLEDAVMAYYREGLASEEIPR